MAHVMAFEFFGGVPQLLVPDNLNAVVCRADRYEPVLNENYRKLARHYNTAVIPARPRKPKDKLKVENAVLVVERWILMRLPDLPGTAQSKPRIWQCPTGECLPASAITGATMATGDPESADQQPGSAERRSTG